MKHLNTYRATHNCVLPTGVNYENMCTLLNLVLDEAYKQMDVGCGMKVMMFANNFYILGHS